MSSRWRSIWVGCLVAAAVIALWPLAPAGAQPTSTATASTASEAWYQLAPGALPPEICTVLAPVCAAPANPYPAGSFHVGVNAGQEEAQTFVTLDTAGLPATAELTGGTLTIPLAGNDAGTRNPEGARLQACLVTGAVPQAEAAPPEERPPYDCATAAPVTIAPAAADGSVPASLSVSLTTLVDRWGDGPASLALVATEAALAEGDTWHLGFSGHDPYAEGAQPPTVELSYRRPASPTPSPSAPVGPPPPPVAPPRPPPAPVAPPPTAPRPPAVPAAPVIPPGAPPVPPVAPVPPANPAIAPPPAAAPGITAAPPAAPADPGYPLVYALPLVAVGIGGAAGTSLTRPMQVLRKSHPPH